MTYTHTHDAKQHELKSFKTFITLSTILPFCEISIWKKKHEMTAICNVALAVHINVDDVTTFSVQIKQTMNALIDGFKTHLPSTYCKRHSIFVSLRWQCFYQLNNCNYLDNLNSSGIKTNQIRRVRWWNLCRMWWYCV